VDYSPTMTSPLKTPGGPSEAEAQRPFQLVRYYSVTSLAIFLLFTLLISTVLSRRAGELVLHKREQYALLLAENLNHQVMTRFVIPAIRDYGGINVGQPAQFQLLDAVVRNTVHSFKVLQVNILDLDGNIIYSTQPEYIARTGYEDRNFPVAQAGGHISVLDPPWGYLEVGGGPPRVLKTFIPLRDERRRTAELGPPRAVFEITLDITQDFREVWVNQMIIIVTLLAMMALLFMILRSIVIRGQRIMGQRASMEARLKEQLNQSERLAALGRMVAGVAHEIRNPLGIVRSTAELLKNRTQPNDQALAQVIVDESTRLGGVVTEFLDFARPQKPQLGPLLVEEVIDRNLQVLGPEAERAGVEIVRNYAEPPVKALGDPDLLYRAFLNVFSNAVQAMEEEGGEAAEEGGDEAPAVREDGVTGILLVSTEKATRDDRDYVVVVVEDTGPGFEDQALGTLFDPFFTTKEQGTGLGLSIVNNIIISHGGRVELKNRPEGGARVEIWLREARDWTD
jgi:two-component system sensor histidine kinase HydH